MRSRSLFSEAGSLAEPAVLAPAIMAFAGVLTILETPILAKELDAVGIALLVFGPPTIGTTLAARGIVTKNVVVGFVAPLGVALLHALVALLFDHSGGGSEAFLAVGVFWGVTAILALPMLSVIGVLRDRRAHDTGDVLLGAGGAWMLVLAMGAAGLFGEHAVGLAPAALVGVATMLAACVRGIRRRAWCTKVASGRVAGFRVRPATDAEPAHLLPIYGPLDRATAVVERFEPGAPGTGTAYRDAQVFVPLALAPGHLAAG